jgi:DNA-binding CsgD family transcriptional regulator
VHFLTEQNRHDKLTSNMQNDVPTPSPTELTDREQEILRLVATGTSNKDIAQRLFISSNTVKVHLRNIFTKIGAASRTEAAMYAVRLGMVQAGMATLGPEAESVAAPATDAPVSIPARNPLARKWLAVILVILALGLTTGLGYFLIRRPGLISPAPTFSPSPTPLVRWKQMADMPTARGGLAAAVYENHIFTIGGEALEGVTNVVECYDPASNTWQGKAPIPQAVADINAAVIGGKIYVPGGRLASGRITNTLEIYDPRLDRWESGAALPVTVSSYALVAFEGKLYLFGGWDGSHYLESVFAYNPDDDKWVTRSKMPTARSLAGAVVADGKIYVLGGNNGGEALLTNEEYLPDRDTWSERTPMPVGRYAMGAASLTDIIYVIGGIGDAGSSLSSYQYSPQQDQWQVSTEIFPQSWSHLGLVPLQTRLYGMGGRWNGVASAKNLAYQAIYTIMIPIVP